MNTLISVSPRQALPLIERVNADASVGAEYPLVFGHEAPGGVIAVGEESAHPRSACAILVRDFVTPQGAVKVGLIGSVATDPAWQGQGLATRVLVEAEAALAQRGCHVALLWANDTRFYYARGYRPIGAELDLRLMPQLAAALPAAAGVRAFRPGDAPAIHALYSAHAARVDRTPEETAALLAIPGMSTLVLERAGAAVAFACLGRGVDLTDVIHEWGGDTEDVLGLLRAHLEARTKAGLMDTLFLMAPSHAVELVARLRGLGCEVTMGILGLGRVLDHGACAELVQRLIGTAGTAVFSASPDGPGVSVTTPTGQGFLTDDLLLALLFPAFGMDDEVQELRTSFGLEQALFPVDLFAWGLDSI
jgi:GNAT superfamily N-acetyltransferase